MGKLALEVGLRLKLLRKQTKLRQGELAQLAGISASQISRLESGGQWGHEDTFSALFSALANYLGIPEKEVQARVLGGEAPAQNAKGADSDEYVMVPFFDQLTALIGGRLLEQGQTPEHHIGLMKDFIGIRQGAGKPDLLLLVVGGDAMEPSLSAGDVVSVDRNQNQVANDGLYLMRNHDSLQVRRLQRLPGGRLRVACDNPTYGDFELESPSQDPKVAVVGRVIWVSKAL